MQKMGVVARIVMGLIFVIFGLNGFFNFLPFQPQLPEPAVKFVTALMETGYMFPLIKGTEVVAGICLVLGLFVPLALIALAPIIVNIFLYHYFLAPEGLAMAIVLVVLAFFLGHVYRKSFLSVLKPK